MNKALLTIKLFCINCQSLRPTIFEILIQERDDFSRQSSQILHLLTNESSSKKDRDLPEQGQQRVTKTVKGSKHLLYEERLRDHNCAARRRED